MIASNAFFKAQKLLSLSHKTVFVKGAELNMRRHATLIPQDYRCPSYYVLFKNSFFMTFNEQFTEFVNAYPEFGGLGESINERWLLEACRRCSRILFFYPDDKAYFVEPMIIKRFCESHGLIRVQEKANFYNERLSKGIKVEHEKTYSFPIKLLKKLGGEL